LRQALIIGVGCLNRLAIINGAWLRSAKASSALKQIKLMHETAIFVMSFSRKSSSAWTYVARVQLKIP